jgi:murein DD-endopeptidase MepM/ murein hydrolase activator NlpD
MADRASRAIQTLQRAGFTGDRLKTAFGIVMRESGGNPQAHNPNRRTGDDSYGLSQINMLGSMGPARRRQFGIQRNEDLLDPAVNARAMFQMSKGGKDFGAWGIGPNAYRTGAGMETIRPFLNKFPGAPPSGAGDQPPAARPPQRAPGAPDPRRAFALELIANSRERRGASPLALLDTLLAQRQEAPQPRRARPVGNPGDSAEASRARLVLPRAVKGTHPTDGLGWGSRSAVDIMAKPGTTVGAPFDGTVVRWGSAQGGEALYLDDDDPDHKPDAWIGHIEDRTPVGKRVRRGQKIARVSGKHPRPHVHYDPGRAR